MKSRPQQQRRLASVLRKTLQGLEAGSEVDQNDPAFIQLKSQIIQRIIQLEADCARARGIIHLVDTPESAPAEADQLDTDSQAESIA